MPADSTAEPGTGISAALAAARSAALTEVSYALTFTVPTSPSAPVRGTLTLSFTLASPCGVVLDFAEAGTRLHAVRQGDSPVPVTVAPDHILIDASQTRAGANVFVLTFTAGDASLNRHGDLLYTLFVPARAHLAFPCFDQPDLRAVFALALEIPEGWEAVANGPETARETGDGVTRLTFAPTPPLPTYLMAFVAGRLQVEHRALGSGDFRVFHRDADLVRAARTADALLDAHARSLDWLERYTGVPHPFPKLDCVLIPSFQFSGMEHPGAIYYHASITALDADATDAQRLRRESLVAHETAHLWFGDLVTLRWFDDVWLKEVFATFCADRIVEGGTDSDVDGSRLAFLLAHHGQAADVDRTDGANAVRQTLDNLSEAGSLYGPIVYHKAPVALRQLALLIGEEALRDGLRRFLEAFRFGSASWADLRAILERTSGRSLASWSRAWLDEAGWPQLVVVRDGDNTGRLRALTIEQRDPAGQGRVWPQRVSLQVGSGHDVRLVPIILEGARTEVYGVEGLPADTPVLVNGEGLAYGDVAPDPPTRTALLREVGTLPTPLARASGWCALWDSLRCGDLGGEAFVQALVRALPHETSGPLCERLRLWLRQAFWRDLDEDDRDACAREVEAVVRGAMAASPAGPDRLAWFRLLRDVALTEETVAWLYDVWARTTWVEGLVLSETDEAELAVELALRLAPLEPTEEESALAWCGTPFVLARMGAAQATEMLLMQHGRMGDEDAAARLAFLIPALSPVRAQRAKALARVRVPPARRREGWLLEAQRILHHPLRATHAVELLPDSLAVLPELDRTGDIFFAQRWAHATLADHRSPEAAGVVESFLASAHLPDRLRRTVLVASHDLRQRWR